MVRECSSVAVRLVHELGLAHQHEDQEEQDVHDVLQRDGRVLEHLRDVHMWVYEWVYEIYTYMYTYTYTYMYTFEMYSPTSTLATCERRKSIPVCTSSSSAARVPLLSGCIARSRLLTNSNELSTMLVSRSLYIDA